MRPSWPISASNTQIDRQTGLSVRPRAMVLSPYSQSPQNQRSPAIALINALLLTNRAKLPSMGNYDLTSAELENMFTTYIEGRENHALENGDFDLLAQVSDLTESGVVRQLVRNDASDGGATSDWPCMQSDFYFKISPLFNIEELDLPKPFNGGLAPTSVRDNVGEDSDDDGGEDPLADILTGKTVEDINAELRHLTNQILDATDTSIAEDLSEINEIIEAIGAAVEEDDEEYQQLIVRRNELRGKARESAQANVDESTQRRAELLGILQNEALPLTKPGYRHIVKSTQDGEVSVATFGNQFVTLVRKKEELYALVTDVTQSKSNVVWERLEGLLHSIRDFKEFFLTSH